jgi:hypothetical protein
LYAGGFVVTVVAVVWISHRARRALARYESRDGAKQ